MKHRKPPKNVDGFAPRKRPENLLDLNRSLQSYTYQPNLQQRLAEPGAQPLVPGQETPKPKREIHWKKIFKRSALTLLALFLLTGGWVGWKILHNELKIFGWKGLVSLVQSTKLKGEDTGHVNILLAGNSADDPGHDGANLTDSIMVVSINTRNNTAFMLSVPRDLYVKIPNHGYGKINEVYEDGQADHFNQPGYATGGMGLLEEVVSQNLGITLNYYSLVDYAAVRQAVDAVGGITVNIQSDDPRGLYDPSPDLNNNYKPLVKLPNGPNTLNGVQALGLARARGDSYYSYGYALSDFTRAQNQRLILLALKDKATSLSTLANPVKLGDLFDSIGNNVHTDLTLGDVKRLYQLAKNIKDSSITSAGLNDAGGTNLLANYTASNGASALIPAAGLDDYSDIQTYVDQLLTPPSTTSSGASTSTTKSSSSGAGSSGH
ncbi:MAG TPA: LCP family protein [Candidatus Saccharimonadales bacterium]|nr:LCP family protein [Candidatus Saccharimonadales bacterium]